MQLSKPGRAQARSAARAGSSVDNASLVPAAFSLCSQPSFFHPFPQERQRTLNCKHLLHTSSAGLARPKWRWCLRSCEELLPKMLRPSPQGRQQNCQTHKRVECANTLMPEESLLFSGKPSAVMEILQSKGKMSHFRAKCAKDGGKPHVV